MKKIIMLTVLVSFVGCASPCMKKSTILEQKQCKWTKRHDRDIGMFIGGLLLSMTTVPNIGYFVLSKNRNIAGWVLPTFLTGWGIAGIGMVDDMYIQEHYPREKK